MTKPKIIFLCKLGIHSYTHYGEMEFVNMREGTDVRRVCVQKSYCDYCNKVKLKRVYVYE